MKFISRKDYLLNETWNKFFKGITPLSKLIYAKFLYKLLKANNNNIFSVALIENIF